MKSVLWLSGSKLQAWDLLPLNSCSNGTLHVWGLSKACINRAEKWPESYSLSNLLKMVDLHVFAVHLALVTRACPCRAQTLFWHRSSQDVCSPKATSHTTAWNRLAKIPVPMQQQHIILHWQAYGASWEENSILTLRPCALLHQRLLQFWSGLGAGKNVPIDWISKPEATEGFFFFLFMLPLCHIVEDRWYLII